MSENLTPEVLADLKAKALKANDGALWLARGSSLEVTEGACSYAGYMGSPDRAKYASAANPAVTLSLLTALEEAEGREKYHGVARFVDAEEIAELMEAGARTWMPISLAKPERNGSIIVMTSDETPVIGQAFWHEHGNGTWALHWSSVSPKDDCWNDPISETNKPIVCFQPLPEGPCGARMKAMDAPGPHMAALLRIKALEEACQEAIDLLLERIHHNPARSAAHNARLTLRAALSPNKSEADSNGQ